MMLNGCCFAFFGAILSGPIALLLHHRTGCMITKADVTCARDPLAVVVKGVCYRWPDNAWPVLPQNGPDLSRSFLDDFTRIFHSVGDGFQSSNMRLG
jgi:hypothetical protein